MSRGPQGYQGHENTFNIHVNVQLEGIKGCLLSIKYCIVRLTLHVDIGNPFLNFTCIYTCIHVHVAPCTCIGTRSKETSVLSLLSYLCKEHVNLNP